MTSTKYNNNRSFLSCLDACVICCGFVQLADNAQCSNSKQMRYSASSIIVEERKKKYMLTAGPNLFFGWFQFYYTEEPLMNGGKMISIM